MKKLLVCFLSALLALSAPAQADLTLSELMGFNSGAKADPVITFLQCANSATDASTYTFSSQNVGTETAGRYTLVGIGTEDSASSFGVSSVTVGGDSATESYDYDGVNVANVAFYILSNPAGTSESVVVNLTESVTNTSICLWSITDLNSTTAYDTDVGGTGTGLQNMSISIDAYGVAAMLCYHSDGPNAGFDWYGTNPFTSRAEAATASTEAYYGAADYTNDSTVNTNMTTQVDVADASAHVCAIVSYR